MSARFVVATDLSLVSRKGAHVAAALAAEMGAELDLVCAVPRDRLREEKDDHLLDEVRVQVSDLARELARGGVPTAAYVVIVKDAATAIARHAHKADAAVVVLAPQGVTGWKKHVFGSVTEQVLRLAPRALLLARPAKPMPPTDILAAIDRSPGAVRALRHAIDLAFQIGARLHVLWVPRPPGALFRLHQALDSSEDYKRAKAREMTLTPAFNEWVSTMVPEGLEVTTRVEEGDAARTILTQARLTKSSLIVMGMHSRSRAKELFVGSTARAVAAAAPMSVLLIRVRPPHRRRKKK
jgi:nucleotide-binding universal stress UspA family protein